MKKVLLFSLLTVFFIESFASILFKSPTWDEPHRLACASWVMRASWVVRESDWESPLSLLEPVLPYYLFGLPHAIFLKFFHPRSPFPWKFIGNRVVIYPVDVDFIAARFPMIILGIILGIYVYRWAKELFGINAGLAALFIYTFSPNILAHTRLITHDISVICFMFVAVYYFWRFSRMPTRWNLFLAGVTFGLALLSKFSGVLLFPIYVAICILSTKKFNALLVRTQQALPLQSIYALILIFLIAIFTVWAGYGFISQRLLELPSGRFSGIRLPAGAYINGIILHFHHTKVIPRQFFLMGKVSPDTRWYFYLVGLLTKVPIAAIIFFCLGVFEFRRKRFLNLVDGCFLVVPVLFIFIYFSFFVPVNRGLRYVLPVFPFIFVFIGGAISRQLKKDVKISPSSFPLLQGERIKVRGMKIIIILLGLWYVISSIRVFPHYLAYFNEFIGGPDNGYHYLVDSDLYWGQDLKGLKAYMERKKIDRIKLDYFGSLDPRHYRIDYEKLESLPASGYAAVSATNLQNLYSDTPDYSILRIMEPVDKIGYSIFIYNFDGD